LAGARSGRWASLIAPAAFLLGVTIAVLLVRSALDDGGAPPRATQPAPGHKVANPGKGRRPPASRLRYAIVRAGDTFSTIAARSGITVTQLERLNPGVRSTALFIGQRIRVG
jgi:hypothetical protein